MISDDGRVVLADAPLRRGRQPGDRRPGGRRDPLLRTDRTLAARRGADARRHRRPGPGRDRRRDPRRQRQRRRPPPGTRRRPGLPGRPDDGPARPAGRRRPPPTCSPPSWAASTCSPRSPNRSGGPLRFAAAATTSRRRWAAAVTANCAEHRRRLAAALIALLVGVTVLTPGDDPAPGPVAQTSAGTDPSETPGDSSPAQIVQIAIGADQVRIVDPPGGDRDELRDIEKVVDGDTDERLVHRTSYFSPKFGNVKAGMGIFIDLGEPRMVKSVHRGALRRRRLRRALRRHASTRPPPPPGTRSWSQSYRKTPVGAYERHDGTTMTFNDFDPTRSTATCCSGSPSCRPRSDGRLPDRRTGDHRSGVSDPPPAGAGTARSGAWIDRRGRRGPDRAG